MEARRACAGSSNVKQEAKPHRRWIAGTFGRDSSKTEQLSRVEAAAVPFREEDEFAELRARYSQVVDEATAQADLEARIQSRIQLRRKADEIASLIKELEREFGVFAVHGGPACRASLRAGHSFAPGRVAVPLARMAEVLKRELRLATDAQTFPQIVDAACARLAVSQEGGLATLLARARLCYAFVTTTNHEDEHGQDAEISADLPAGIGIDEWPSSLLNESHERVS